MRRRTAIGLCLALAVAVGSAAPAGVAGTGAPVIVVFTDTDVEILALDGQTVNDFKPYEWVSLDGNVFAGSRGLSGGRSSELIRAADATTGAELFRIRNAFAPIVLAGGTRLGFLPDRYAHRDPYFASVWIRNAAGRERAVVRFAGPGRTVTPSGLRGEGVPLDPAWDEDGRTLAVAYGNDVDLFIYDVWVIDVQTRQAVRVSRGKVSRFPTLSPSGDRLALVRDVDLCGGPAPGYRAGEIRVMSPTGEDESVLLPGTCALFYTDPRWVSETELVAKRLARVGPGQYEQDLVLIDAATAGVTEITSTGDAQFFTASASLQAVAYVREGVAPGFSVYDLTSGQTTTHTQGYLPQLAGVHRLT
ncbi:MAG: TolB family protein [Actinomycetota bacterium]